MVTQKIEVLSDGVFRLFGYGRALVEQRVDALLQLTNTPAFEAADFEVEIRV